MSPTLKKIARVSFITLNITAVVFYLAACLVPSLNEGHFWFIALLGLVFPLIFFIVLFFLLYWMIRRSRWAFLSFAALLLSWKQVSVMFGFHTNKTFNKPKSESTLRVLSWNISSWGKTNRANKNKDDHRSEMIDLLNTTNADVICLQEFPFTNAIHFRDSLISGLSERGYKYGYFAKAKYTMHLYHSAHVTGVVILSKYPFADTAAFNYGDNDYAEPLVYADIKVNEKMVRVYTTHLQSVRFDDYDYEGLHSLKKEPVSASITQSRATAWKLKQAYKKRAAQAELLHEKIKASPYPVIVCGDFNDVPNSYTYFTVKENLQDAFLKKAGGFGRTFRFISPTLRIDYILADKKFEVTQFNKFEVTYSDHYPIIADLDMSVKN
jgi:endonuclease/exonuclease/phosphatase family metal-dependent hydrolase